MGGAFLRCQKRSDSSLHGQIYYKEALTQTADGIFGSLSPHLDIVCEVFWQKMAGHIKGLFWPDRWSLSGLLKTVSEVT